MRFADLCAGGVALAVTVGLSGCGGAGQDYHPVPKGVKVAETPHQHEHGPHGGHLVELGEEEYHAEVVYDAKAAKVTIFILDSTAKNPSPIDAKDLALKLTIDGKSVPFAVPAAPESGDPKGKASKFELAGNAEIKTHIKDEEDLKGSVDVKIGSKSYSGQIKHEH